MSTVIWWLDALKRTEKIIRENDFEQKKKNPGLEFNLGLALIGLWTTCRAMNIWVSWLISSGSPLSAQHNTIQHYNEAILEWEYIYRQSWNERKSEHQFCLEWFSFECRKTKTKVITLANHIGHRQCIEPIKTRSNYMWLTQSAGKCMRARHNWLWFYFWLDEKVARIF